MNRFKLFIVEDEESVRQGVLFGLKKKYDIEGFADAESALAAMRRTLPDLILLDIGLPGMSGIQALREFKEVSPRSTIIMVTAYEDVDTVVSSMKLGAYDYVTKPIYIDSLMISIENALESIHLRKEVERLQEKYLRENMPCFIGESDAIQDVMQVVEKVAKSPDTPVLITGESGTGKELIASAIHYKSPLFNGPFVTLNCAAIPKDLLESELFGYEKGAFTGANISGKAGLIEQAAGGTLFLDEVGDLSMEGQSKLLRFLEEGEYYRVGGTKKYQIRTRVLSATNKDLSMLIEEGHFRLDLYYRLAVVKLEIPSLNQRRDDILPIARHFLIESGDKLNKTFTGISTDAEAYLKEYLYKGNIRELRNMIERGALISDGPILAAKDLMGQGTQAGILKLPQASVSSSSPFPPLPEDGIDLGAMEEFYIKAAYERTGGNDKKAAALLKMNYYAFRYRKKKMEGDNL